MPQTSKSAPARRFSAIGRCVYCGADDCPLTEEHIIPFALGGNLILPEASCEFCRVITGRFEQFAIKSVFEVPRVKTNGPTRRPKERKSTLSMNATVGGVSQSLDVPHQDFPFEFMTVAFDLPRPLNKNFKPGEIQVSFVLVTSGATNWTKQLQGYDGRSTVQVRPPNIKLRDFARMLAKIGHCAAVAEHGVDGFKPLLCDLILNDGPELLEFVGGWLKPVPEKLVLTSLHDLDVKILEEEGIKYVVSEITLLIPWQSPTYVVVAGIKE